MCELCGRDHPEPGEGKGFVSEHVAKARREVAAGQHEDGTPLRPLVKRSDLPEMREDEKEAAADRFVAAADAIKPHVLAFVQTLVALPPGMAETLAHKLVLDMSDQIGSLAVSAWRSAGVPSLFVPGSDREGTSPPPTDAELLWAREQAKKAAAAEVPPHLHGSPEAAIKAVIEGLAKAISEATGVSVEVEQMGEAEAKEEIAAVMAAAGTKAAEPTGIEAVVGDLSHLLKKDGTGGKGGPLC